MKKISLIASAVALTFGFAACAPELPGILDPLGITEKDDDSSSTPASTTPNTPTPGAPTTASVTALSAGGAITNTPDYTANTVEVKTANGTFKFTKTGVSAFVSNRAVAESSSTYMGTWEFEPAVATNAKYKGTFTGTVSSTTSYTITLSVNECKRPEDTEYRVVYASPSPVTFNFTVANSTLTAEIPAIEVVVPTTPTTPTTPTQTSSITEVANEDKTYSATLDSYNVTITTTSTGSYTAAYGENPVQSGRYKTYTVTGIVGISKILVAKKNAQPEDIFDYTTTEGIEVFIVNEGTLTSPTSDQLTALAALKNSSGTQTPAVTINAAWDFTNSDRYNIGATENDTAVSNVDLPPTFGSGATLHVDYVKGKYKAENDISGWYIGKGSAYVKGDNSKAKARFTVILTSTATLKIVTTGNGNTEPEKRWVYVLDSTGAEITGVNPATSLSSDNADTTLSNTLPAGTYQIWMSGNRLYKISVE